MQEKEELLKLVNECNSFSEILRKQGKAVSGTSVKLLRLKLEDLEIPHSFLSNSTITNKPRTLLDILVKGSSYKSLELKKKLIKAGLKEDRCELCGQSPEWNGKPLVLQVDHINGDHYDNRLENLRIVCPNCHSLTDTFSNRRNKKRNFCKDCGCEIQAKSTYCNKCASKHRCSNLPTCERPSKERLLELIKTKSFVEIGHMYGVVDNTIRKWCKNYGLPHTKRLLKELYK